MSARALGEVEYNCQRDTIPRITVRQSLDASGQDVEDVPRALRNGRIEKSFADPISANLQPEATPECQEGWTRRGGLASSVAVVTLSGTLYSQMNGQGSVVATLAPVDINVTILED